MWIQFRVEVLSGASAAKGEQMAVTQGSSSPSRCSCCSCVCWNTSLPEGRAGMLGRE